MLENSTWSPRTSDETTFQSRNDDIFAHPPQNIQLPGGFFPHAAFKDALWITLQAKELSKIHTGGRGGNLTIGRTKTKFKFLAPPAIVEMHNHDWTEYASIASRMLEKIRSIETGWEQLKAVAAGGTNISMDTLKSVWQAKGIDNKLQSIANAASKVNLPAPNRKVDTPLTYSNSQRRQLQLEFQLADNAGGREVVQAVKLMQSYAAATTGDGVNIGFPHIWKIQSEPEGLLLMEAAAMTSIQPTWQYPFIHGYPTRCELTVSFTDMSPLFQKTITTGTLITIHPASKNLDDIPIEPTKLNNPRRSLVRQGTWSQSGDGAEY